MYIPRETMIEQVVLIHIVEIHIGKNDNNYAMRLMTSGHYTRWWFFMKSRFRGGPLQFSDIS